MSLFTSVKHQAVSLTQKALRLGGDFVHPVSDDSSNGPDYPEDGFPSSDELIALPHTDEWGPDRPTTTFLDPATGLLTTGTQGNPPLDDGMSIYDIYADRAARMGDEPLYTYKDDDGQWRTTTANETLADIRAIAKGLLHYGLKKGDGVAFMCRTSYEWNITDAAVMACGGVLATVYDTDSAEQIRNIVNNSDARLLIVGTTDMREKADGAIEECPSLEHIICIETGGLDEIRAYGASVSDEELDARIESIQKTDLCSIVYTSGSTAAPKGVEMTHEHYCTTALNLPNYMPELLHDKKNTVLLFLPQAHSFARAINYIVVASDIHVYIAQGIKTLIADLQVARPSVMIVVPRVLEKVYNAASQKAGHGPKGVAFAAAVVAAQNYMKELSAKGHVSALTRTRRAAFDPLVYKALRDVLGGRAKWIVAGGAPLDPELLAFFRGANVPVYEGYGLTETTAPCAFNPLGVPYHQGSVGIAFPGFDLRIAEDEEIQVRGTAVFPKYHKNEEATEGSFTEDGWYHTGDLGRLDHDGFLYITGRKKDLIITAGGKNVAPGPIEEVIQRCEFVSQALVLGDKRPFISALVTLDEETLRPWLESKGLDRDMSLEDAANNAAVRAEVQKWVDQANEGVSRAESVRKFIILPEEFTQENGLMTASMKVIRPKVIRRYATLLNTQMYTKRK
ncbi:MAG: AMP-dependent synthetase/ligase [Bifidobacterium scardovii]|uniref:AMP-dependent synthetase/ligase n=1 Tax=Bifidobacterium scardovii TaxID=158787 RepID=UPI0006670FFD|nr:AMP-dependent synthetase/ligase [Bifidobacterium scardovii]MBS6948552.1 long-chain fatty acid--CoA ligase [Bifidobacterium scardovii]MDU3735442.1 AMP-dependent synthetase/ligase [Bifidobacterium scardovii]MDU5298247.1 AMP-dependent synthetase/ligase [Bifidobacterium scardovii]MDU5610464.1 AMP-dependent synthetase/ligase [Bifidobacterium scardovii]MDU5887940.1 AMP-dependent synthetase/ligase [Bifidobacterium scardovii]